jgi:pyruvate dehydrogenase (quinone)
MIGSSFPYSEWLPEEGQARGVQIDIDARVIGMRYPMEVNLVGDARETLRALLPLLERKPDRAWRDQIEGDVRRWWEILDAQAHEDADPINPQLVFQELSPRLPDGCILTADSGSGTNWWARHLRLRSGMQAALSGTLATMCPAVPYALAAKLAYPDRPVIASVGDGAFQMLGMNALLDIARYRPRFRDPRLIVLVLNNRDLNQVTWEQRVLAGDPKLEMSQVDAPDRVADAWDEALAHHGPVVYEAVTDPEVPPLPPHIRFDQAKQLATALAKGDPARGSIVRNALRGKLQELLTR